MISRKTNTVKRTPVSGNRDILTVDGKEDGYEYRWVNDIDNRIQKFKDGGYELVEHDVTVGQSTVDSAQSVGTVKSKPVGKGTTSYLMRIKKEWHAEDQKAKQRSVAESEASLYEREDGQYGNVQIK